MAKTRVASRVKSAVGGKSLNESQDLVKLTENYHAFIKRLQALIAALKDHYRGLSAVATSRHKVRRFYVEISTRRNLFFKNLDVDREYPKPHVKTDGKERPKTLKGGSLTLYHHPANYR